MEAASAIADAISEIEIGRTNLSALGERLRDKALAELDYDKIAGELSAEYSRISGKETAAYPTDSRGLKEFGSPAIRQVDAVQA